MSIQRDLAIDMQGIQMQPAYANEFQESILEGNFDRALSLLPSLIENPKVQRQVCLFFQQTQLSLVMKDRPL